MTGLFNTVGHETEPETREAASNLFDALGGVHRVLADVERGHVDEANGPLGEISKALRAVAQRYEILEGRGNPRPLFLPRPGSPPEPAGEVAALQDALRAHGISTSLRNRDLFGVAAKEVRSLADVLDHVHFTGRHGDWYPVRDVVFQVNRLTTLGVVFSRIAALEGRDPHLLE